MTLPPEKIGDKGQRFQIKFRAPDDGSDGDHCLGYAGTSNGAERMAEAWRKHPRGYLVWVVDRDADATHDPSMMDLFP